MLGWTSINTCCTSSVQRGQDSVSFVNFPFALNSFLYIYIIMSSDKELIFFHYTYSPFARRVVMYLNLRKIPYSQCVCPSSFYTEFNSLTNSDATNNPPTPGHKRPRNPISTHPSNVHRQRHLLRHAPHPTKARTTLPTIIRPSRHFRNNDRT